MRDGAARALARRAFDALERAAVPLAGRRPAAALAVAHRLGWWRNALSRRWPSPAAVGEVLGLPPRAAARVACGIGAVAARNRLCAALVARRGYAVLRPLVRWHGAPASTLRPPAVVLTFHLGAQHALGAALPDLPGPQLALRWSPLAPEVGSHALAYVAGGLERRAAALRQALGHLAGGGVVLTAADGEVGATVPALCLGRPLAFGRGPLFLAAYARAPLVPLVARWQGGAVAVELGPALPPPPRGPAGESAAAAAVAEWLGSTLRRYPDQLSLGLLRRLTGEA